MAAYKDPEVLRTRQMRARYNALPTVFWSVICLYPVGYYSYCYLTLKQLYIFVAVSALSGFLPKKWLDALSIGIHLSAYKKLKVHWVNAVTQNGNWVNSRMRGKIPDYKSLKPREREIRKLVAQTYIFERFHLMLMVYFLMIGICALLMNQYWWTLGILAANIIYNIYPNLLQQYIRLRLNIWLRRNSTRPV